MALTKRGKTWHTHFVVNGQRFRQSLGTKDWREAQAKEKQLIAEASVGKLTQNSTTWRETIVGDSRDLIGLQQQLAASLRQGLTPLLGEVAGRTPPASAHSKEAYDLYLRSLAITPNDPGNLEGIKLLEQSVQLDPGYAPAWSALGGRYHAETLPYANADSSADEKAGAAYQHALLLDPNLMNAAVGLINRQVERGQLELAYREVSSLLQRRPDSPRAHLSMAYVLAVRRTTGGLGQGV